MVWDYLRRVTTRYRQIFEKIYINIFFKKMTVSRVNALQIAQNQVDLSSIVYWGYQDNFKPVLLFFFFYEKISRAQKHVTPRSLCAREKLLPLLFSVGLFLFC